MDHSIDFDFLLFWGTNWFVPLAIVALSIGWAQIWGDFFIEGQRQKEIEERFLDFVRNLAGAIKSGMPVPRAIIHVSSIRADMVTGQKRGLSEFAAMVVSTLCFVRSYCYTLFSTFNITW